MVCRNEKRELEVARAALREHRILDKVIHEIDHTMQSAPANPSKDMAELARLTRRLREHLEQHFDLEEETGLFDAILSRMPSAEDDVREFRREHAVFLEELDLLLGRLERGKPSRDLAARRGLRQFVDAYESHERAENEIFQRAYYLDFGGAD